MELVKEISPTLFEVDEQTIKIATKKGRKIILCSCDNVSYFGHNQFCRHKEILLHYLFTNKLRKKLVELVDFYKLQNKLKEGIDPFMVFDDLDNLIKLIDKLR